MKKHKVLCLTDHTNHSNQNSVYALLAAMCQHPKCAEVQIASRANSANKSFFYEHQFTSLDACKVDAHFNFEDAKHQLNHHTQNINPKDYDIIFLRLPRPVKDEFLLALEKYFAATCIINKPSGIIECSSKAVLLNFNDFCPPMQIVHSINEVLDFYEQYNLVLKPLKEYGGKGLIRIKDGVLNDGMKDYDIINYLTKIEDNLKNEGYLAMQYMENVSEGDKRLIVVGGEILAASIRLPAKDSWLCNVALGGTSIKSEPDENEVAIVDGLNPFLLKRGILMYGVDTLVNEDGKRILSEINALSIGGFPQAEAQTGRPIIQLTLDKFFTYANFYSSQ